MITPVPNLFRRCALALLGASAVAWAEPSKPAPPALDAARALVTRILPAHAVQIDVEYCPREADGSDAFEVETRAGRLVLRGQNGVTIGSALKWYLRNVAHAQISWNGDNLALPAQLDPVPSKVRVSSPYRHRVYLNYCTFNYTASWWDRARWEREIDWMALNGVTTPLAATGQEAVWQNALRRVGFADEEIRRYLVGPAYGAWQWMTNIEEWGGPLPQSWIDSHAELGRFILERERALGMTPILQGFTGCVPLAFLEMYPKARILKKKVWCLVPPGTAQLDPEDPLFAEFGRVFLEEQTRLFGTDHLYACDPFHEGEPPKDTPDYLHDVGVRLFQVTQRFDPEAIIVMQGWTIREGIVRGIPADRLLALDLTGQKWRETGAFWGRPWVAGIIQNYGGRHYLGGNLPQLATNSPSLLADPRQGGRIVGVGLFPEAIEHNPLLFDLGLDLAWHRSAVELPAWVHGYVLARYGHDVPSAQHAWSLLLGSVYSQRSPEPPMESPLLGRPALTMTMASPWGSFSRDYDVMAVWDAWAALLSAAPELGKVDTFRFDLVDVARQALADLSVPLQREVAAAWESGDARRFHSARDRFLELGADLDTLLATRRDFLLGRWLADARRWGTTPAESDLCERNARLLLTVWGPESPKAYIFDYAGRQWAGMLRGFYLERWKKFFAFLETQRSSYRDDQLARGTNRPDNDANPFYRDLSHWEYLWCESHETYPTAETGDSVETARALLTKWLPVIRENASRFDWQRAEFRSGN
ncbi:alpha-N-acetylglucosaminidase [Opitutaceae bacterium EW11]|nr:alpha-N-acetylglucosaminidase [Opitutaceae bacterium EW11]